jgi:hypothetical protein
MTKIHVDLAYLGTCTMVVILMQRGRQSAIVFTWRDVLVLFTMRNHHPSNSIVQLQQRVVSVSVESMSLDESYEKGTSYHDIILCGAWVVYSLLPLSIVIKMMTMLVGSLLTQTQYHTVSIEYCIVAGICILIL